MAALLVATDHRFLRHGPRVYDTYCFDRAFFEDYRKVFDSVEVIARVAEEGTLPPHAAPSDGEGVRFVDVPDLHGLRWLFAAGRIAGPRLAAAVARADALVIRIPSQLGYAAARLARRLGKPYLAEIIGDARGVSLAGEGLKYRLIAWREARRLKRLTGRACAVSYVSRLVLPDRYPAAAGAPVDFISSIRLAPSWLAPPRTWACRPQPLRIAYVASLLPYKRHEDLLRACGEARRRGAATELHLVGDGPCRPGLEELVDRLEIADAVRFHGHVSDRRTLQAVLDGSDLFITASATEGLPRAVLEAMARGLPAAGVRVGGVPELLRAEDLVEPCDVAGMAELLVRIAADPERLTAMSRHSAETAARYTADRLSPKRLRLYTALRAGAIAGPARRAA